jgi:hypothetical protein
MTKLTKVGLFVFFAAIFLLGCQAVLVMMGSDKMGSDLVWVKYIQIIEPKSLNFRNC